MLKRFFKWWFKALATLLPEAWRQRSHREALVLRVDDTDLVARHHARGKSRDLGRLPLGSARDAGVALFGGLNPQRTRVEVCLPKGEHLHREFHLPLAAEENLREVLEFEMERRTPFRLADVYFDYRVDERDREHQQLVVGVDVVQRKVADRMLGPLEAWDLEPDTEEKDDRDEATLRFVPRGYRRNGGGAIWLLATVNLALLGAVVGMPIIEQQQEIESLNNELATIRARAGQATALEDKIAAIEGTGAYLIDRKSELPAVVELLDEVSAMLPDDTYLFRFEVKGQVVSLQGSSSAASALISQLESSAMLQDVRFVSPVTRDARSGGERFHLSATIVNVHKTDGETLQTGRRKARGAG